MVPVLMPIDRCAEISGLRAHEMVLGVSPGAKHERLLSRYHCNGERERARVRLVADIRDALELGATKRAADLLIVLRSLLATREAGRSPSSGASASAASMAIAQRRVCGVSARSRAFVTARGIVTIGQTGADRALGTDNVLSFETRAPSRRG